MLWQNSLWVLTEHGGGGWAGGGGGNRGAARLAGLALKYSGASELRRFSGGGGGGTGGEGSTWLPFRALLKREIR